MCAAMQKRFCFVMRSLPRSTSGRLPCAFHSLPAVYRGRPSTRPSTVYHVYLVDGRPFRAQVLLAEPFRSHLPALLRLSGPSTLLLHSSNTNVSSSRRRCTSTRARTRSQPL